MPAEKSRDAWADTLRLFASLWIFFVHLVARNFPLYKVYINTGPLSIVAKGISGKLCVAVFGVLLGYYASKAAYSRGFFQNTRCRYLQFVCALLLPNLVAAVLNAVIAGTLTESLLTIRQFFSDTFFFSDSLVATYWCMADFLCPP